MSKHWVIRIHKPPAKLILTLALSSTFIACGWWLIKRLTSRDCRLTDYHLGSATSRKNLPVCLDTSHFPGSVSAENSLQSHPNSCYLLHNTFPSRGSVSTVNSLPLDCGAMGLGTLNKIIDQLEDCMSQIQQTMVKVNAKDSSTTSFINELRNFLETSYLLREKYKRVFIQESPIISTELQGANSMSDFDSESYFSSVEIIDFSELEVQIMSNFHRPLYKNALQALSEGKIVYRYVRTDMMKCHSDIEYLGKLVCVRTGFDYILSHTEQVTWLKETGQALARAVLTCLGYGTAEFETAFGDLLAFLDSAYLPENYSQFVDELASKDIQTLNFYDVVFDRILIDALENLSDPPSSVLMLTRNTWLSAGFKKAALDSAVWTLMSAKRKLLKYPDGFFALYYRLVETVAPALAWGFLASDESVSTFCQSLRKEVVTFVRSLYKFADNDESEFKGSECASTVYQDFEKNDEDDDVTITPEETDEHSNKRSCLPEPYNGLDFINVEDLSSNIYANMEMLKLRISSLIIEFSANYNFHSNVDILRGLPIKQPPLPAFPSSDFE